jgi:methylmalonyl-CoA decarboxylase
MTRDPISSALAAAEDRVLEAACSALDRRDAGLRSAGGPLGAGCLAELLRRVLSSVERGTTAPIEEYTKQLLDLPLENASTLTGLQAAVNALEEALSTEAVASLEGKERAVALRSIAETLGAGRAAITGAYAELARLDEAGEPCAPPGSPVAIETRGMVGIVRLDHLATRNALGASMAGGIVSGLERLAARGVRAVVIRSSPGMAVWSSGHDINELARGRRDPLAYNDPLEQCVRAVRSFPRPVIAMVHGSVWGAAFDLVLSCDVVIADETATFAITPANLGLPYNTTGLLHFLGRMPMNVVKEMFFTARPIGAHLAERWLVVNHLVTEEELEPFTFEIAATMASKAPLAIAAVKEQLRVLSDYQPVAAQVYERVQSLRRDAYDSDDYLEGLAAFAERRRPVFRGR